MQTTQSTAQQHILTPQAVLDASVIIVSYNSRDYLPDLCQALSLANPPPREVILVDNASTDGSADYVAAHFPEIKLVRMGENLGFSSANNQGAALAQGEFLIFLNPDTRPDPAALGALVTALGQDPHCGMSTARILLASQPDRINTCGNQIHLSGITLCRGAGQPASQYSAPDQVSAVSGAAFAMRRDLFHQLGGFDPVFFMYLEDTDLSLRARLAGWTCCYVPAAVVAHDYRLQFSPNKTFYLERNRYWMLLKHFRLATLTLLLPVLLLAEAISWGFVLLRQPQRWRNKTAAYAWVWRHRQELAQARQCTQALRRTTDRALLLQHVWRLDFAQVGSGPAARLAALVFNPLFAGLKALLVAFLWW